MWYCYVTYATQYICDIAIILICGILWYVCDIVMLHNIKFLNNIAWYCYDINVITIVHYVLVKIYAISELKGRPA